MFKSGQFSLVTSLPPAVTPNEEYILELLQDTGMITGSQVFEAREHASAQGVGVVDALIALGFVTEEDITRAVAAASNMEFVDLGQILVKPEIIDLIPRDKAYRYKAVPHRAERRGARRGHQ